MMSTLTLAYISLSVSFSVVEAAINSLKITPANFNTGLASKVSSIFFTIDFALVAWGALECVNVLHHKFEFIRTLNSNGIIAPYVTNLLSIGFMSVALVNLINTYTANKIKKRVFANDGCDMDVEFKAPNHQIAQQVLLVMCIAHTIFLTTFRVINPFITTLSLTSLGFSLYKVSNRKWMSINQVFYHPNIPGSINSIYWSQLINKISANFFFPLLEVAENLDDDCSICFEGKEKNEPKPDTYFCNTHVFHIKCLSKFFKTKSNKLLDGIKIISYVQVIDNRRRKRANIRASIPLENLQTCPNCRGEPVGQELYLWISENPGYTIEGYPTGGTHGTDQVLLSKPKK